MSSPSPPPFGDSAECTTQPSPVVSTAGKKSKRVIYGYQSQFLATVSADIGAFLETCISRKLINFAAFFQEWNAYDLPLLYALGFSSLSTRPIIMHVYILLNHELLGEGKGEVEQIIILYTIYCLYYCQPWEEGLVRMPIPLHPLAFAQLKALYRDRLCKDPGLVDGAYIFHRLCHDDALQLTLKNIYRSPTGHLPGGGLVDLSRPDLVEPVSRLQRFLQKSPVEGLVELSQISADYESLRGDHCFLSTATAPRNTRNADEFIQRLEEIINKSNRTAIASPEPRKAASSALKQQRRRRATLPERPSTAPPFERHRCNSSLNAAREDGGVDSARSASPLDFLSLDADMPDLARLLQ